MSKEYGFSPSRREFLKVMGAAAFLMELGIPAALATQMEKTFENKEVIQLSFEEGMRRLKDRVWEKSTESAWVFIEKGGKSGWIDLTIRSTGTAAILDAAFLRSLFERFDISQTYFAHTHPYGMYNGLLPEETINALKGNRKSDFPLLPSSADIFLAANYKKLLEEKERDSEKIKHYVLEPSGVWEYDVDTSHSAIDKFFQPADELASPPGTELETELQHWRRRFIKDGGMNGENLEEFIQWAESEYGITFAHHPHY